MMRPWIWSIAGIVALSASNASTVSADGWKAGTARAAITPKEPTWMAGYAARTAPSKGALHDIWAKALVLEDAGGKRALLITLDVCGIDATVSGRIRKAIVEKQRIPLESIALACSHTHSGPVLGSNLITMYKLAPDQSERIRAYTEEFVDQVIGVAARAVEALEPADVDWGRGFADFAVNRRENAEPKVVELKSKLMLRGPVDHDVPVLRVRSKSGAEKAIVCGYACHCTVLDGYEINGDYAGFAQIAIEKAHPGAQAMFVAGCGADQNPQPRRKVEMAERHGSSLAHAVEEALAGPMRPVGASFGSAYEEIPLAFASLPTPEEIEKQTTDANFYIASRAKMLKKTIAEQGKLSPTYPYPVQAWVLGGGEISWIFLGGEVVVDYALRLKRNLGAGHTWVTAYANDVPAYIPSLRVLEEGGYEGGGAMVYYGRPASWSKDVEESIVASVGRMLKAAWAEVPASH
ncbi:MAG: neutral/alkaline non-lysosomal ceramidase N-terminal domain-containing protein [Isosphaeraceae bacterium]|nr:neutral/alkaline non-lysosomal ceramidase N-terminal domain-containing protein [Isosphaeraceae bacterium]